MTLLGNQLKPSAQAEALCKFPYRNTVENPCRQMGGSKLPPITDQQWLAITKFTVTKNGDLDGRSHHCFTVHSEIPEWKATIDHHATQRAGLVS